MLLVSLSDRQDDGDDEDVFSGGLVTKQTKHKRAQNIPSLVAGQYESLLVDRYRSEHFW